MLLHKVKFILLIEVSTFTLLFCFERTTSVCFVFSQAVSTMFFKTSTARISGNSFLHWHKLLSFYSLIIRRYWQVKSNDPLCISWRITFSHTRVSSPLSAAMPIMQHRSLLSLLAIAMGKTTFSQVHCIVCTLPYVLYQKFGLCGLPHISQWCFVGKDGWLLEEDSLWWACQAAGIPTAKGYGPLRSL